MIKLKRSLKVALKSWNTKHFGCLITQKDKLIQTINSLDDHESIHPLPPNKALERNAAREELISLAAKEEIF